MKLSTLLVCLSCITNASPLTFEFVPATNVISFDINSAGQLVFIAAPPGQSPGIYRWSAGQLSFVGDSQSIIGFPIRINDLGTSAWVANEGVRTSSGALVAVNGAQSVAIDNAGNLAYGLGYANAFGIAAVGVSPQVVPSPLLDAFISDVSMNDAGDILIRAYLASEPSEHLILYRNGVFTVIDSSGPGYSLTDHGGPAINNAGIVAYYRYNACGSSIISGSPSNLTTLAAPVVCGGQFGTIYRGVQLSDVGTFAFIAEQMEGTRALFSGPDPIRDRVVALNDPLFGSTLLNFGGSVNSFAMSDDGRIAFAANLADGRTGIVLATPASDVPEPTSFSLMLLSAVAMFARRRSCGRKSI